MKKKSRKSILKGWFELFENTTPDTFDVLKQIRQTNKSYQALEDYCFKGQKSYEEKVKILAECDAVLNNPRASFYKKEQAIKKQNKIFPILNRYL